MFDRNVAECVHIVPMVDRNVAECVYIIPLIYGIILFLFTNKISIAKYRIFILLKNKNWIQNLIINFCWPHFAIYDQIRNYQKGLLYCRKLMDSPVVN